MNPSSHYLFARSLVLRYGWNSMGYQILNPGIALWFSQTQEAVIGYAETRTHIIAAGSPVTAEEHLDNVVVEFSEFASRVKKKVCFFGAQERIAAILSQRSPTSSVQLGAQPAWSPEQWLHNVHTKQSLRAQLLRARNKGVTVSVMPAKAGIHSMDSCLCRNDIDKIVSELKRILAQWIASRHLPPMRFLVESDTLGNLADRIVTVAHIDERIVGFCVASPIPLRKGWLVEQVVRGARAPNGTAELMLDTLMQCLHSIGSQFVTMGLSPLSRHYTSPVTHPFWLKTALHFTRLYGKYFYNFDGLDSFKAKFLPTEWEPVYAITNERTPTPLTLYAIASAFSGMSPVKFVLKGVMKMAVRNT